MKILLFLMCVTLCPLAAMGQSSSQKPALPPHSNGPATEQIETETVGPPGPSPAVAAATAEASGYMEPAKVKALTHKLYLAEYRLNDLLTQVNPDKWKMSPATRKSFDQTMASLHNALAAEEDWRGQFDKRPDSLYLGFQTYVAISAVLPRVDGVARAVSQYDNVSLGVQYSQSVNQFFDLQQSIEPLLAYLLKNQDGLMVDAQSNLASCQNELNYAMAGRQQKAIPMKNIAPVFQGRGRPAHTTSAASRDKPADAKGATPKPAANPPDKTQKN